MKNIDVLLREHVKDLGRCGEVVRVAPGYANNYLLPKHLAVPATEDNKKQIVRRAVRMAAEEAQREAEVASAVEALSRLSVKIGQKADEGGHLYGSVSAAMIAELCAATGSSIDEKRVHMDAPIKTVGEHKVRVHVHGDEYAEITVVVEPE